MSLPTIPDITPKINLDRCDTINMLLSSIALEEIGLSHILNAEGEKIQAFIKSDCKDLSAYLKVNESVNKMLRTVVKSQILLQFKLEDVISLSEVSDCNHCKKHCKDEECHCCHKNCHNEIHIGCHKECLCNKCKQKKFGSIPDF